LVYFRFDFFRQIDRQLVSIPPFAIVGITAVAAAGVAQQTGVLQAIGGQLECIILQLIFDLKIIIVIRFGLLYNMVFTPMFYF